MNPHASFLDRRERDLPPSPIPATGVLAPLRTWAEILEEHRHHGVEFDAFWYESLTEGVCFFYRWQRVSRAIVLVVLDDGALRHIECRTSGDTELSTEESAPIVAEVVRAFAAKGMRPPRIGPIQ